MAVIKVSKKNKTADVQKALRKLAKSKVAKKKISDFYGALPTSYGDGLAYQLEQRNEWK